MARTVRHRAAFAFGALAWWLLSCRDIPAPEGGVLAISGIRLPAPGLVVGDTMRDSTGAAAPLRLVAYDANGDSLAAQPTPVFVTLDTVSRIVGAWLIGSGTPGTTRIVGGVGSLQTQPATINVTLSPDTIAAADSTIHHKTYSLLTGDTVINSAPLTTRVLHRGATETGVASVIVRYTIDQAPAGKNGETTIQLRNGAALSARDTTDAGGRASLVARLRVLALASSTPETTAISATASYRGQSLGTVRFTVIFHSQ